MTLTMTRRVVTFTVYGHAEPQGSAKAFIPKGWNRAIVTSANPNLKAWRALVTSEAQRVAGDGQFTGPVAVGVAFFYQRPKSLPKRVLHNTKRPDVDKALRGILDSLSGVLYHDDAQVVRVLATKHYAAPASAPCAVITVAEAAPIAPRPLELSLEDLFTEEEPAHA